MLINQQVQNTNILGYIKDYSHLIDLNIQK